MCKKFAPSKVREDFPIFRNHREENRLIYLDNSATTQRPQAVIDAVSEYYSEYNANVHRGIYSIAEKATEKYENTRKKIAEFINAPSERSIIFTKGTTEAINLVAYAWARKNLQPGDEILITEMEHHSNIIPWQLAARDTGALLKYIPIHKNGTLDISQPEKYFTKKTKMFGVIQQSNVFGTINPVNELIRYAHDVGALVLVDGAQFIPHSKVDVHDLDCDFYAFSGHKMLAPSGVGVLYGKEEILESMEPFLGGGDMILNVTMETATWNEIPYKFEAGTPNIAQVIGLGAAVDYLNQLGIKNISEYIHQLTEYALKQLSQISGLKIHGSADDRESVVCFELENIHPHDVAQILNEYRIAVRAGHLCTQPVMQKLAIPATTRASFYIYNTKDEIDRLAAGIRKAVEFMG